MSTIFVTNVSLERSIFGLYGAGGFAREVMPFAMSSIVRSERDKEHIYFIESQPSRSAINGYSLVSEENFFKVDSEERFFNVAIGDSKARQILAEGCLAQGATPLSLKSENAIVYDNNEIGDGAILCAHTMVTSNVKIGKFFHCNIYSYVAHDCVIGDYVTFAPGVHCNGHIHIHDHAYIGTGAIIKPGTSSAPLVIGEGAVIGMGAVVTKDVQPYTTVIGNPARVLSK